MSEKRNVPTFRIVMAQDSRGLEGPVVSPDRKQVVENLSQLHSLLSQHSACLVYAHGWHYVPYHSIEEVQKGTQRFQLPWPLTDD